MTLNFDDHTVFKSPLEDFIKEVEMAGLFARVIYLRRGEAYDFSVPSKKLGGWWNKLL